MAIIQDQVVGHNGENSKAVRGYERLLRVVGQALEKNNVDNFELTPIGESFHIRGEVRSAPNENFADRATSRIRSLWDRLPNRSENGASPSLGTGAKGRTEIVLTMKEIEALEAEGRGRRVESSRIVDTSSLPQVLRCLGAYLQQKRARLLKLTNEGDRVIIDYETTLGSRRNEAFSTTALYDMWVRMYLQRAGRFNQKIANAEG